MQVTLTINSRGTLTLPAKLRREIGLSENDLLIAETTDEGLLLKPAVALPVEIYSKERIAEFAAEEKNLDQWYAARNGKDSK